jgi:hypothetical protein
MLQAARATSAMALAGRVMAENMLVLKSEGL